jgi:hypothetical protein
MLKVRVFTTPRTVKYFESLGLPGALAYVTIAAELGGAACLILGIWPRRAGRLWRRGSESNRRTRLCRDCMNAAASMTWTRFTFAKKPGITDFPPLRKSHGES